MNIHKALGAAWIAAGLMLPMSGAWAQDDAAADVGGEVPEEASGDAPAPVSLPSELMRLSPARLLLDIVNTGAHLVAVGDRGAILVSNNGNDWAQVQAPTRSTLNALAFADSSNGWAVGHDAVILHTKDGGQTWDLQNFQPELEKPLLDVLAIDANTAFAVGAYGLLLHTTDAGASWNEVDTPIREDELHFNAITRLGNGELFLAGEQGKLAYSADGGATWTALESPYEGSFFGALPRGEKGVMIFGLRGNVYVSEDGRGGWTPIDLGSVATLFGGALLPDGSPVLAGLAGNVRHIGVDGSVSRIPVLVKETDAQGNSQLKERTGTLSAVLPFGDRLLLVGENGVLSVAMKQ
ncbi:MAG TPA: YCF48-related protein [Rhodocyclaceae bacterium]